MEMRTCYRITGIFRMDLKKDKRHVVDSDPKWDLDAAKSRLSELQKQAQWEIDNRKRKAQAAGSFSVETEYYSDFDLLDLRIESRQVSPWTEVGKLTMKSIKLWVDDLRYPPEGYIWITSVNTAKQVIALVEEAGAVIELIDLDHDAGHMAGDGGDYIQIMNWLETTGRIYPIRIHTMNSVGRQNMKAIIRKNNWKELQ